MELQLRNSFTDYISLFFVLALVFGIAIFTLILYNTYNENIKDKFNEAITSSTPAETGHNVTNILDKVGTSIGRFNILFPIIIVGALGFIFMIGLMSKSHPAFLFLGLLILGIVIILAVIYSNVYEEIAESDTFTSSNTDLDIIAVIMSNLPIIILIAFIGIGIILYYLKGGGEEI